MKGNDLKNLVSENEISTKREKLLLASFDLIHFETTNFWHNKKVLYSFPPLTTNAISSPFGKGSDSKPYKVMSLDEHKKEFFLVDSSQFYLEFLLSLTGKETRGLSYMNYSFRGNAIDKRHLHQFVHSEVEFKCDLDEIINLAERYIFALLKSFVKDKLPEIPRPFGMNKQINNIVKENAFKRVKHVECIRILEKNKINGYDVLDGAKNINSHGESWLNNFFGAPFWITHFPEILVPFYVSSSEGFALNADLIMGGQEVLGASQRWTKKDEVIRALKKRGVNPKSYGWYIDLKSIPQMTSGFGMGVERFLSYVLGIKNISETQIILKTLTEEII